MKTKKMLIAFFTIGIALIYPKNVLADTLTLETIKIDGFTAPVEGNRISKIIESDERYDLEQKWINTETNEELTDNSIFEFGKTYSYNLTIIPSEDYSISEGVIPEIVNEKNDNWDGSTSGMTENGCIIFTAQYTIKKQIRNSIKNGWVEENGDTYYYINDVALTGHQEIDGYKYYFESDGKMHRNFLTENGKIYYYGYGTGRLKYGWSSIGNDR